MEAPEIFDGLQYVVIQSTPMKTSSLGKDMLSELFETVNRESHLSG